MPTIADLQVRIGADIKRLEKGIDRAQRKLEDAGRSMRRVGTKMTAGITAPLAALGTQAVKSASKFESLQQSMNILNGSVEEGTRNFERLKRFSAETPFQLRDLAEAQNMLQGFGQSADEAFESMSMIGDIAAVASGDIKGIGIAFGQAAAEGRLMTRDIRQLINQGVPAIKLLANTMDVAQSEVLDLASEGEISFEILQQAFRDATTEGGMFANGMEKQANTLAGVWSTLKDNVSIALAELGNSIVETFDLKQLVRDLTANIQQITERFQNLSKESQAQILKVAGLFAAGGPLLMALGQAAIAISAFAKFVRTRFAAITVSVAAFAGAVEMASDKIANLFGSDREIKSFTQSAKDRLTRLINPIIEFGEEALGASDALEKLQGLLSGLGGAADLGGIGMEDIDTSLNMDLGGKLNEFSGANNPVERAAVSVKNLGNEFGKTSTELQKASSEFDSVQEAMEVTKDKAKVLGTALQQSVTSAVSSFAETLGNAFTGDTGAEGFFNNILMVVNDFANKFGKLLIAAGTAALAFENLLANPVAAIAAGATLVAATTAIRNLLQKGPGGDSPPELAQGGLAFGPTMAVVGDNKNARSNPEVIAPLDKLKGMMGDSGGTTKLEAVIRGSDIHLANERGKNKFR